MALRNEKVQDKKHLTENRKEKLFQMILHFQTYLLVRSNVPHFSIKKESVIMAEMTNFWWKNMAIFHEVKK